MTCRYARHGMTCFIVNSPQIFGEHPPASFYDSIHSGRWVDGSCSSVRMMALQRTAEKIVSSSPSCVSKRLVRSYLLKSSYLYSAQCHRFMSRDVFPDLASYLWKLSELMRIRFTWLAQSRPIYIYTLHWLYICIYTSIIYFQVIKCETYSSK